MGGFFEFPEPEPAPPRPPRSPALPWHGPPHGALPGAVPLELVLARNDRAAVGVTKLGAYPTGFDFDVVVVTNEGEDELEPNVIGHPYGRRRGRFDAEREMLRFGVQFADGGKVTNLPGPGRGHAGMGDEPPPSPVMHQQGGGGGSGEWRQRFWVWPLPTPGPLTFACEWPAAGIELTLVEVDAQLVIDAAGRAQQLFEHTADGDGASWSSSSGQIVRRLSPRKSD
jgi:hypothetical protein